MIVLTLCEVVMEQVERRVAEIGEEIEYYEDPEIKAVVVDDRTVSYEGQTYSLTALAKKLSGRKYAIAGPKFFKYKGEWLNDIRQRLGV